MLRIHVFFILNSHIYGMYTRSIRFKLVYLFRLEVYQWLLHADDNDNENEDNETEKKKNW